MSSRSNPFGEIERFFERMGRNFEDPAREWGWGGFEAMSLDIVEKDGEFVVTADLPGFEREEVSVRVNDHTLHVEAEHGETEDSEGDYIRRERRHRSSHRTVRLPGDVDAESVEARMRNGVLTITLPKAEKAEAKRIEIGE
jgi:HSP20 family protein